MSRKKHDPIDDVDEATAEASASALPEKFDDFVKRHNPGAASKPVEAKTEPKPAVKPMGGMVEKRWSGLPMWECPRCGATTFNAAEAKVHTCKELRFADDAPTEGAG